MNFFKTASAILTAIGSTVALAAFTTNNAYALSEVSLPSTFAIENANNRNMVVDKFGDNPSTAARAHQYTKENPSTYTLRGIRSSNGSYEVQLVSSPNLCFTADGGLNPNMGNGTLAVFSGNCANSLNLRFFDDGTVRVARNTNMCLTNQGNRYNATFNRLHFWTCDGSSETKFVFSGVGNPGTYVPVVQNTVTTPVIVTPKKIVTNNPPIVKTQPTVVVQTSGFSGVDIYDFNPLSDTFSTLNIGNGQRVKVNVSQPGTPGGLVFHTYTYFSNSQANEFVYAVKKFKNSVSTASKVAGYSGVIGQLVNALKGGGFIGGTSFIAGAYYEHMTENTLIDAEYCINKGKGFWIDAKGGILFLDQAIKCDK